MTPLEPAPEQIAAGRRLYLKREDTDVEGAGASALAALPQLSDLAGPIVLVVTGRNIDDALFERARTMPESFS